MSTAAPTEWNLKGSVLIACNCDWGCPCNFNAMPSKGHCEGGWTWHVERGAVDGTALDGLSFTVLCKWPGAIHHGNGVAMIYFDDRATPPQREAIQALVSGKFGGPWGVLAWTWPTIHGPKPAKYDTSIDGLHSHVRIGESVVIEATPIKNPVTGAEAHPSIALPEGIVVKRGDLCATSVFRLNDAIAFDHSGQYAAVGPFEYAWRG
jgi:hypothetical protein